MSGVNKVILLGNIGKDPEVRYGTNGGAITNLSLATSETWKDKNTGEKKERTEWHRVVAFGKAAEILGEYLKKGDKLYVEGKIGTRKWTDKDGNDRYSTEITVTEFQLMGGRNTGSVNEEERPSRQSAPASRAQQQDSFPDEEVPF